jgi:hypothetical protein
VGDEAHHGGAEINQMMDTTMRLKRRALEPLLNGRHAHAGGRTLARRAKNIAAIASAYTREELLSEPGIGHITALEIEYWLQAQGKALRSLINCKGAE